jgi:prepilin-type N-terminal cleavage/methylation domain-containing protein
MANRKRDDGMKRKQQSGFTLLETMVALVVFLSVSGIVASGMIQMLNAQGRVANRTEMHTSVRSATELLQQEVGQAGRISFPSSLGPVRIAGTITTPGSNTVTLTPSTATNYMYTGMLLDVDSGDTFEVVTVTAIAGSTITATFINQHTPASGSIPVQVSGGFGTGIVPPVAGLNCVNAGYTAYPGGSDCFTLKLYGDINGDGNITYIEYKCPQPGTATSANPQTFYRNEAQNALTVGAVKQQVTLLSNVVNNPSNSACFTYQVQTAGGAAFVTDVAVTLTVQTQLQDPQTHQYMNETKALLNVTPRNVFYVWEVTSYYAGNTPVPSTTYVVGVPRNQPMPATVTALL